MTQPDWSKAPEGATHFKEWGTLARWYKIDESKFMFWSEDMLCWTESSYKKDAIIGHFIPRPTSNTQGLPEVGEEFEWSESGNMWHKGRMVFKDDVSCLIEFPENPKNRCNIPVDDGFKFRPLPRTITIGDMEVPEPVREPLEKGQSYFIPFNGYRGHQICVWDGVDLDYLRLKQNIVHLSLDNANLHFSALIKASGGEVE